jgi:Na+/proline symporter
MGYRLLGLSLSTIAALAGLIAGNLVRITIWPPKVLSSEPKYAEHLDAAGGVLGFAIGAVATYLIARYNEPARVRERHEQAADYDDEVARPTAQADGPMDARS